MPQPPLASADDRPLDDGLVHPEPIADEAPPVLGSWPAVYTFVLVLHVLLILAFYFFSRAYA